MAGRGGGIGQIKRTLRCLSNSSDHLLRALRSKIGSCALAFGRSEKSSFPAIYAPTEVGSGTPCTPPRAKTARVSGNPAKVDALIQVSSSYKSSKSTNRRRLILLAAIVPFGIALAAFGLIFWKATTALKKARQELKAEAEHGFAVVRLEPPTGNTFSWISAPAAFSDVAVFQ